MATVVNNPGTTTDSSNSWGFVVGILLLIIFLFALLYYGLPALNNAASQPAVSVPEQVDVNINSDTGQPAAPGPEGQ